MRGLRRGIVAFLRSGWMQPVSEALGHRYKGLASCLLYHRIVPGAPDPHAHRDTAFYSNLGLAVTAERFAEQMRYIREHQRCVPLSQAVAELVSGRLKRGTVVVTFDDGYRDNLRLALPILRTFRIPATICITTGLIDRRTLLWWEELEVLLRGSPRLAFDWSGRAHTFDLDTPEARGAAFARIAALFKAEPPGRQQELMALLRARTVTTYSYDGEILSWDEVRELERDPLITIAAHTVNHPVLSVLEPDAVIREMRESRARLEQELGRTVPYFAYPFGGPDEVGRREFDLCAREGFEFALTTRTGHWHRAHRRHVHALPRIMVEHFDTLEDFRFKLSGLDALLRQKGRRVVTA